MSGDNPVRSLLDAAPRFRPGNGHKGKRRAAEPGITQDGVAVIYANERGSALKYAHNRGEWFMWDGTRWRLEPTRLAFHEIRILTRGLNSLGARECTRASFVEGVERFARADRAFAMRGDEWDRDPWLLNTPDGTVDLRTGETQPHDRSNLITKITAVQPRAAASKVWLQFLAEATQGDDAVIAFLQRMCGYALTGNLREECLFYLYGPGGNGKGTFSGAIFDIFGEYAVNATMDTFLASNNDRHSTDLAMLHGARLVIGSEVAEGRTWDEQRIKAVTGNDPITARFMRQDNFTFMPQFTLLLSGNHRPHLRSVDDAWRRRIHLIPFLNTPQTKDMFLKMRLKEEYPEILHWMIEGHLDWQASGLQVPQRIRDETAAYLAAQDVFGEWLSTCCEMGPNCTERSQSLYASWKQFAERSGEEVGSSKVLADRLQHRKCTRVDYVRGRGGRGFQGIRLRGR